MSEKSPIQLTRVVKLSPENWQRLHLFIQIVPTMEERLQKMEATMKAVVETLQLTQKEVHSALSGEGLSQDTQNVIDEMWEAIDRIETMLNNLFS